MARVFDQLESLTIYGFFRDFETVLQYPDATFLNINIEGVRADEVLEHPDVTVEIDILPFDPVIRAVWTPSNIVMDQTNRKMYTLCAYTDSGSKHLEKIFQFDANTWDYERNWDSASSTRLPAADAVTFNDIFINEHIWPRTDRGDGKYMVMATKGVGATRHVAVLDTQSNSIKYFNFDSNATYGLTKNTSYNESYINPSIGAPRINHTHISEALDRVYVCLIGTYYYQRRIVIGYFDLTEDGPTYTFNHVVYEYNLVTEFQLVGTGITGHGGFKVFPTENKIILSSLQTNTSYTGFLLIWNLDTGTRTHYYRQSAYPAFPVLGIGAFHLYGGSLYGRIIYDSSQSESRGLCKIDLSSHVITFFRPGYATLNNYGFPEIIAGPAGRLLMTHYGYGVAEYTISSNTWKLYNNTTVPGMAPLVDGSRLHKFARGLAFDPRTYAIMAGHGYSSDGQNVWGHALWERFISIFQADI